jgi:hypothetical protein
MKMIAEASLRINALVPGTQNHQAPGAKTHFRDPGGAPRHRQPPSASRSPFAARAQRRAPDPLDRFLMARR